MKILADQNIPGLAVLAEHHDLRTVSGREIAADDLVDVDALLIRSVTTVDEELLAKADVLRFVGSATIGTDHVDQALLKLKEIDFVYAPGCNANGVVDYVLASLFSFYDPELLLDTEVGIVGCGNVGGRLLAALSHVGVSCRVFDPLALPKAHAAELGEVMACDIVSLHVPLTYTGPYATASLVSQKMLTANGLPATLINTSRGEIIERSLPESLQAESTRFVCDVWHSEPVIDHQSVLHSDIATPHIAGYSRAGKLRGSSVLLEALANRFDDDRIGSNGSEAVLLDGCDVRVFSAENIVELAMQVNGVFDLKGLSRQFKRSFASCRTARAKALTFDNIRKNYRPRPEIDYRGLLI